MSRETRTVYWTIDKAQPGKPVLSKSSISVNGPPGTTASFTVTRDGDGAIRASSSNTKAATVSVSGRTVTVTSVADGSARITVTVQEGTNYLAYTSTNAACSVTVSASEYLLTLPAQSGTLTYNGNEQSPTWDSSYNSTKMDVVYTLETNAGRYSASFTPKSGYVWADTKTVAARDVSWSIGKAAQPAPTLSKYSIAIKDYPGTKYINLIGVTRGGDSTNYGKVTATSSDANVLTASADTGTAVEEAVSVTIVSAGSANITVHVDESTNYYAYTGNEAVCSVDVTALKPQPEKVQTLKLPNGARDGMAGTAIGNYALFVGGRTNSSGSCSSDVYAYDDSLTLTRPTSLSQARTKIEYTGVGNYALFAGGYYGSGTKSAVVDAYNASLTRTVPAQLSVATHELGAASAGDYDYALFDFLNASNASVVNAYNASLTRSLPSALSTNRHCYGAAASDKAIFAGGYDADTGIRVDVVDYYTKYLTRSTSSNNLSLARYPSSLSVRSSAYFAGGFSNSTNNVSAVVDIYSYYVIRSTGTPLSDARQNMAAVSVNEFGIFAGGTHYSYSDGNSNVVDGYNRSGTRVTLDPLSSAKTNVAAASVGYYALFAGGYDRENGLVDDLEVYSL